MAAYRRVYGFGHLWADCRGPGLAPEPYARFEYGTNFTFNYRRINRSRRGPVVHALDYYPANWVRVPLTSVTRVSR